jgi:membrane associated rhomboid family serine protease
MKAAVLVLVADLAVAAGAAHMGWAWVAALWGLVSGLQLAAAFDRWNESRCRRPATIEPEAPWPRA